MDSKKKELLIGDHHQGMSYRTLAGKYGVSVGTAHQIVMPKKKTKSEDLPLHLPPYKPESLTIDELKEELRLARLKIELQDLMLDIAGKELGVDLRKKHGTRRSK